ncbi:hypothetical protein ES288_A08G163300v1 [Gossypium darwinii]|uniref:Uncharacterized protein n=1 Tax=Gossypium darwinii TaxID=34276 RepID=A0A5D2FPW4_GOSDA|nr:hypothetical protein ES288_A08G163300v1 [Gossypium darwinii]
MTYHVPVELGRGSCQELFNFTPRFDLRALKQLKCFYLFDMLNPD